VLVRILTTISCNFCYCAHASAHPHDTERGYACCPRRPAEHTGLLLQADADTGCGNALNVYFVVRAFENAGMAAIMVEDQIWPKRCEIRVAKFGSE